jgi:hypothetical protein
MEYTKYSSTKYNNRATVAKASDWKSNAYLHEQDNVDAFNNAGLYTAILDNSNCISKRGFVQAHSGNWEVVHNQVSVVRKLAEMRLGQHLLPASVVFDLPLQTKYLKHTEKLPIYGSWVRRQISKSKYESSIDTLILKASAMLNLPYDWDGDEAMPIEQEIFDLSTNFLKIYLLKIKKQFNTEIQLPQINPCPDGTIDLDWATDNAQLLINIRKANEGNEYTAYYYGDKYNDKMPIKDSTPLTVFSDDLAIWMIYLK